MVPLVILVLVALLFVGTRNGAVPAGSGGAALESFAVHVQTALCDMQLYNPVI